MSLRASLTASLFMLCGVVFFLVPFVLIILLWGLLIVYTYNLYLILTLSIICIGSSAFLFLHGLLKFWDISGKKRDLERIQNLPKKFFLGFGIASIGLTVFLLLSIILTLFHYFIIYDELNFVLPGVEALMLIIPFGSLAIYSIIGTLSIRTYFLIRNEKRIIKNATENADNSLKRNQKNIEKSVNYFTLRNAQIIGIAALIAISGCFMLISYLLLPTCNSNSMRFSDPAYPLPSSPHYNSKLDNPSLVNQTILAALEEGLRAITKLQKRGGFPMWVKLDGSAFYSDRGFGCPLFEGEFSLQGGTALLGGLFIEMYQLEPNPVYLQVAQDAADALVAVQDEINGGFYYDGRRYIDGRGYQPHPRNTARVAVLDDDVMQSCMRLLLNVYDITKNETYLDAIDKGFDCLFAIEKPQGGWPQMSNYPPDVFRSYVTLNDDTLKDVIFLMFKASDMFPEETKYMDAAERACFYLKRVQGNGGASYQKGWAQQYDGNDQPAWARDFEPPAICSRQTVSAMECLLEMYLRTGNNSWLEPIPKAIEWLELPNTTIMWEENGINKSGYSRLYELGTNIAIYGYDLGKPFYSYKPIRPGYGWQGDFGVDAFIVRYNELVNRGYDIAAFRAYEASQATLAAALSSARMYYKTQTQDGFWLNNGYISDASCAAGCQAMMNYIKLATS